MDKRAATSRADATISHMIQYQPELFKPATQDKESSDRLADFISNLRSRLTDMYEQDLDAIPVVRR